MGAVMNTASEVANILLVLVICGFCAVTRNEAQIEHRGAFYEAPAKVASNDVIAHYAAEPAAPPTLTDADAMSRELHDKPHHGNLTVMQLLGWRK